MKYLSNFVVGKDSFQCFEFKYGIILEQRRKRDKYIRLEVVL